MSSPAGTPVAAPPAAAATPARPLEARAAAAYRAAVRREIGGPAAGPAPSPVYPFVLAWDAVVEVLAGVLAANPGVAPTPVHLSQEVRLLRSLRAGELLSARAELVGARRHRAGASLALRARLVGEGGATVAELSTGALLPAARWPEPFGDWPRPWSGRTSGPVASVVVQLPPGATARYAEVSGDRNPVHLDAAQARAAGFEGTVTHGMHLLALACEVVVDTCAAGDAGLVRGAGARFAHPVPVGEAVVVSVHESAGDRVPFTVSAGGRTALKNGWVEVRPDRG